MDIQFMFHKMNRLLGYQKLVGNVFLGFHKIREINPCPRTIISNTCEQINVSGDILNTGGNVE